MQNWLCHIQEYMYQGGIICQGLTCVASCSLTCFVLRNNKIPNLKWFFHPIFITLLVTAALLTVSIFFGTAHVYCRYYPDPVPDDRNDLLLAIYATLIFPIVLSVFICFFMWVMMRIIFRLKGNVLKSGIRQAIDRMLGYVLIYSVGWAAASITLIEFYTGGFSDRTSRTFLVLSAVSQSLAGAIFCLQDMYFLRHRDDESLSLVGNSVEISFQSRENVFLDAPTDQNSSDSRISRVVSTDIPVGKRFSSASSSFIST